MNERDVRALFEKADHSVAAAELLLRDGFADFAAGRAYYAMFYGVEALFLAQHRSFSKHIALISAFGKEFIKTGLLPAKFHRYLLNAFDLRNLGDYGTIYAVDRRQTEELIAQAQELMASLRRDAA